jgi:hypothetical protein
VAAAGAVDELEVEVDRLPVAAEADRQLGAGHRVEVQRRVPLLAGGPVDRGARPRRDVHLGLDPGDGDLGDLADLGRQRTLLDEEHVGGEPGALVTGLDVGHHARDPHLGAVRELAAGHHDVVELQELVGRDADGELERARGHRADHEADRSLARHRARLPVRRRSRLGHTCSSVGSAGGEPAVYVRRRSTPGTPGPGTSRSAAARPRDLAAVRAGEEIRENIPSAGDADYPDAITIEFSRPGQGRYAGCSAYRCPGIAANTLGCRHNARRAGRTAPLVRVVTG